MILDTRTVPAPRIAGRYERLRVLATYFPDSRFRVPWVRSEHVLVMPR